MYRASREVEPTTPRCAAEFCHQIRVPQYGVYYGGEVKVGMEIGIFFYSDKISQVLSEIDDIQFDGTFYTAPIQFYQLWIIFTRIGRHLVPCIHCLLTSKQETPYTALLHKIHELFLNCHPVMECQIGR